MEVNEQPTAPYLDAVVAYAFRGPGRYHVPGHKGGPGADPGVRRAIGPDALATDVPQDIHGIDLGPSPTPYERAEQLAAEAFGAQRTFFLTNGATQGNHTLCLALAPLGTRIVAQRNSHASIVDGLVLSGGLPSFVAPEYDGELGITHCVTPESLEAALRAAPDAKAAFIVSPTYYGMAADVARCAEVAHAAGVPLVVDQAWGPHFGFHEDLPPTALSQGADAMLTSTHKIAGSLTQSAMLHVGHSGRIDPGAIARALRLLRSTSPSSLLMLSLDGARRQLALHGEQLLYETLQAIDVARAKLETIDGIALVDASVIGRMGVAGYEPLRIVLDVRGTGRTGYEIADALRRSYDVHVELPMQATVVFVVGLGESAAVLRRLAGDVDEVVKRLREPGATAPIVPPATALGYEIVVSPRDAFLGEAEQVAVDDAVGRISCESIASYPPGVPALLPGERISAETVTYLRELAASGARLHGASDPAFQTINVLCEAA
jgi:arginine decarboxylase